MRYTEHMSASPQTNRERELEEALAAERAKSARLAARLSDAERRAALLQDNLDRIKNSGFWRVSTPLRDVYHAVQRTKERVSNYGGPRGIARKLKSKSIERHLRLRYGTASFPSEEERKAQRETVFPKEIKFSILVPLYNTPQNFLTQMLDSVVAQTYENWELCLADGSDDAHSEVGEICRSYASRIPRIRYRHLERNEGISGNTNECLAMATGSYIGLFDHDDVLHPSALYEYMCRICGEDADYLYCDETTFKGGGTIDDMITLHFKPDYAIDNLRANNYICHFSVFARELLDGTELFRPQFDGSQDHDMILRLTGRARHVVHVPRILYYWRSHAGSVAADIDAKSYAIEAARGAVADHLTRAGFRDFEIESTRAFETIFRIKYALTGNPRVSILIPNKDHVADLTRCIQSIRSKTTYDNYEILVIENGSAEQATFDYYDTLEKNGAGVIRVLRYEPVIGSEELPQFNFSAVCNFGARAATGEYLLLLNNDTEVITVNWIEELLMYAQRPDVGAVGAKLYYEDRTIQHAGIVLGLGAHRTAGHVHYRVAQTNLGYMGRLCYAQDFSAVTGACLMVRKRLYDELGGLDERFAVALNDVDFCLRLRERGLWNVWNPYCELYHYESKSRGSDLTGERAARYNEESARFRERWGAVIDRGDPFYNINFSLDRSDFSLKEEL
ncbi:MAG: glycosyltransferase family 2 protein [Butyrivibrio sp.]|nr:glycosyltransferase family 2 protein [Butyrivibrio sp.]